MLLRPGTRLRPIGRVRGMSGASWTPDDLAVSPTLWLDPTSGRYQERSSPTTPAYAGQRVGTWAPRYGSACTAPTDGARPVYESDCLGGGVILLDPYTRRLSSSSGSLGDRGDVYCCAAFNLVSQPNTIELVINLGSNLQFGLYHHNRKWEMPISGFATVAATIDAVPGRQIVEMMISGGTATLRVNGTQVTAATAAAGTFDAGYALGGFSSDGNFKSHAAFGDLIVCSPCPSADDRAKILAYVTARNSFRRLLPTRVASLSFHGNSITSGSAATTFAESYSGVVSSARATAHTPYVFSKAGETTPEMIANAAIIDQGYDSGRANYLVGFEGINDINNGSPAGTALANLTSYYEARRAAGWKVVIVTVLPTTLFDAGEEAERIATNSGLRTLAGTSASYALADLATDAWLENVANFPDGTHPPTEGHARMATIVGAALSSLGLT